jgi:hypothetical protein
MSDQMNNVLLIGKGYWGKNWYNTLLSTKTKFSVVDPILTEGIDSNDTPNYKSLDSVNLKEFTHAIVSVNANCHVEIFTRLSKFIYPGRILIEKPCGMDSDDAKHLTWCFPGFLQLHSPAFTYIQQNLHLIGTPRVFKSTRASMGPRVRTDVSVVEDYMVHDLYIFLTLFGWPDKIDVISSVTSYRLEDAPPDTSFVTLKNNHYPLIGEFFSSWWYPHKERKTVISGDKGSFIWLNDDLYFNGSRYEVCDGVDKYGNKKNHLIVEDEKKVELPTTSVLQCELENLLTDAPKGQIYIVDVWNLMDRISNKIY